jgi:FkbM family methyltransferase
LIAARTVGRSGRVIAFEPLPDNIVHLCRHVRINRLANVDVLAVACSDAVGITSFTTGSNGALGHISDVATVAAGQGGPGGGMTTWVPTVDLDGFVARTGFRPNVIKIDVEGAERRVLDGASELLQRHGPEIFLSTHGDEMRDVCLKVLRGYGYEVRPLNAADESSASEFHAKRQ